MPYMPRFTPLATALILVNLLFFLVYNLMGQSWEIGGLVVFEQGGIIYQALALPHFMETTFALHVLDGGDFRPWQVLTSTVMHASIAHILFNLLLFWFFASGVEERLGPGRFSLVLIAGALGGSAGFLLFADEGIALGLSGVVSGVAVAFALILWRERVMIFLFMVPAWLLVVILIVLQDIILGVLDPMQYEANTVLTHVMHLSGALFGGIATLIVSDRARENITGIRRRRRVKQFRVIPSADKPTKSDDTHEDDRLDAILAKVSREGVDALTAEERTYLNRRSKQP